MDSDLHVVMFPFFAFGHISPFVQLSKRLSSYGVQISFLSASGNVERIKAMLKKNPTTTGITQIDIVPLTIPPVDGLPPGIESTAETTPATAELLHVALDLMQPQIKTLLSKLKPHFILFDFAQGDWLPQLASQHGIKTIFFSVFTAIATAFGTVPARLTSSTSPTVEEMKKPPPGFPPTPITSLRTFEARDYLNIFNNFSGDSVFARLQKGFTGCTAILIKTCNHMEKPYLDYIKSQYENKPLLLAGPIIPEPLSGILEERWAKWLDEFPPKSIVYCSFGSETFLKDDHIKELALGLELTGLPFFLVLNFPASVDASVELNKVLPQGFVERVKGKGIVHTGWVQQQHILAHNSVGCYVCHAGFSSITEALVNDCQVVMLAQKGDQFLNSKLVGLDLKAGLEINRNDENGDFGKEDVCKAVKIVMVEADREPGKSITANQKKWKEFLVNDEIHSKFITDLVKEMKAIADKETTL